MLPSDETPVPGIFETLAATHYVEIRFALRPVKSVSGKWLWLRDVGRFTPRGGVYGLLGLVLPTLGGANFVHAPALTAHWRIAMLKLAEESP